MVRIFKIYSWQIWNVQIILLLNYINRYVWWISHTHKIRSTPFASLRLSTPWASPSLPLSCLCSYHPVSASMNLSFQLPLGSEDIWCFSFCTWHVSLSKMSSNSTITDDTVFLFVRLETTPLWTCTTPLLMGTGTALSLGFQGVGCWHGSADISAPHSFQVSGVGKFPDVGLPDGVGVLVLVLPGASPQWYVFAGLHSHQQSHSVDSV